MARTDIDESRDWIIAQLEQGASRLSLCRHFGCRYDTLGRRLTTWGVTHLKNQAGKNLVKPGCRRHVSAYLSLTGPGISSHKLKLLLIRDGLKEARCELCAGDRWMGQPIPLELDHINGDHHDNRLENLRIVCPNCHAQTATHAGKNNRRGTSKQQQITGA